MSRPSLALTVLFAFGGGSGRTYTITATATNLAGLVTTQTAQCVVPHDSR